METLAIAATAGPLDTRVDPFCAACFLGLPTEALDVLLASGTLPSLAARHVFGHHAEAGGRRAALALIEAAAGDHRRLIVEHDL